jgi:hypothetical protein
LPVDGDAFSKIKKQRRLYVARHCPEIIANRRARFKNARDRLAHRGLRRTLIGSAAADLSWPPRRRDARDKISAIVKSRRPCTCRSEIPSMKNGVPLPICWTRPARSARVSTGLRPYRPAVCEPVPPTQRTTKWRFGLSKKRQKPLVSMTFLTIFSEFFCKLSLRYATWPEFGPEMRWCEPKLAPCLACSGRTCLRRVS